MREKRSLLNFAILIVVAVSTAVFLLNRAQKAIAEIEALQNSPAYLGLKNLEK